jgi:hypothetical protein
MGGDCLQAIFPATLVFIRFNLASEWSKLGAWFQS